MTLAQRFAQVFGGIYLLVGILGFIPPLLIFGLPGGGPFAGYLIGLFVVNWLHNLAHILIGVGGLPTGTLQQQIFTLWLSGWFT
jgi:hypothetical protein